MQLLIILCIFALYRVSEVSCQEKPASNGVENDSDDEIMYEQESCVSCVGQGCVFCKADDFFDHPSVCVCEEMNGFFESCSDYSFGAKAIESNFGCQGTGALNNNNKGTGALTGVIIGVAVAFLLIIGCTFLKCCNRNSSQPTTSNDANQNDFGTNSTPGAASFVGAGGVGTLFTSSAIPATTVHNATPAPSAPEMDIHVPFATPVQGNAISSNTDPPQSTFDALQNKL